MAWSALNAAMGAEEPVVILFSTTERTDEGWEVLSAHACGGFASKRLDGWAYLIHLREGLVSRIAAIAQERFSRSCLAPNLNRGVSLEHQIVYKSYLREQYLSVSYETAAGLMQGAYPLDATKSNLTALVGEGHEPTTSLENTQLLILGYNCVPAPSLTELSPEVSNQALFA